MRYWWVNQNQTFKQELGGGYLWSPKRNSNDARKPFYEFMREVAPGDLILSFQGAHIRAIGVAQSHAYECPKPAEFGSAGPTWDKIGWKVNVRYVAMRNEIKPADHMARLAPLLPAKYAPLRPNGHGLQSVYLTELPAPLMHALCEIIGREARDLLQANALPSDNTDAGAGLAEWEEHLRAQIEQNPALDETERVALVLARRGQGLFKQNVHRIKSRCRVSGVERLEHLRASHIQPWRDSDNEARLDGENGFLLAPNIDHLFDRGFITFDDSGRLLTSPVAHMDSLRRLGVPDDPSFNVGGFSEGQRRYLEYHRHSVFLEARRS